MNGRTDLLPDVPFEEKEEFDGICKEYGLDLISLIAPTSHERISMIAKASAGICVLCFFSGVTGMRSQITTDTERWWIRDQKAKDIPLCRWFWYLESGRRRRWPGSRTE